MPRRVVSAFGLSQTRRDTKAGLPPTRKDAKAACCGFPLRAGWNGSWSYDQSKGTFGTYGTEWRGTRRWSVSCRFVSDESRFRVRRCDDARRVRHGRRDWRGEASSQSAALMANIVARRYGASSAFVVARKRNGHALTRGQCKAAPYPRSPLGFISSEAAFSGRLRRLRCGSPPPTCQIRP